MLHRHQTAQKQHQNSKTGKGQARRGHSCDLRGLCQTKTKRAIAFAFIFLGLEVIRTGKKPDPVR